LRLLLWWQVGSGNCSLFKFYFFRAHLIPRIRGKYKVNTDRAPPASVRLHTLGCRQVSQRLR
jgi:hypothetical protein